MDGTLLDLHYDNRVWNELVPAAFAQLRELSLAAAKEQLLDHMRRIHGSIEFYSFDYWCAYTGLDLVAVHKQATTLITYRPGALEFLRWLKRSGRKTIIATNAHRDSLMVKEAHSGICKEVDAVVSSHDYAAPKESRQFWQRLGEAFHFQPQCSLFIDDNEPVLDSAASYGISHLRCVSRPDSRRPARAGLRYPCLDHFKEICPGIAAKS
jgi:putative hydrolase of the HAD superfamily